MWPFLAKCAPGMLVSRKVVSFSNKMFLVLLNNKLRLSSFFTSPSKHLPFVLTLRASVLHYTRTTWIMNSKGLPPTGTIWKDKPFLARTAVFFILYFEIYFLLVCMCVHMHAGTCRGQKRVAGPRSQSYKRLWATAVGTGNWTGFSARAAHSLNS